MSTLWDEIHEQPAAVERALASTRQAAAPLAGDRRVEESTHVVIAARGTSDNAARYAQYVWGARNHRTVALAAPSLFGPYAAPPRLDGAFVVAISQSGASPDLIAVVEEAVGQGRPTMAITNEPASPLAGAADHVVPLDAGPELAVAATKTYTASLAVVAALSDLWRGGLDAELRRLPEVVAATLAGGAESPDLGFLVAADRVAVVGRGYNQATAFEMALKMQELSQVLAHPYSAADFRHGPLALVEPGFPIVLVTAAGALAVDLADLAATVAGLGADVLTLGNDMPAGPRTAAYAATEEWLSPIPAIVAGQLLTHHLTRLRGLDPDSPRTITKVTRTH